jgi:hypothetical protein
MSVHKTLPEEVERSYKAEGGITAWGVVSPVMRSPSNKKRIDALSTDFLLQYATKICSPKDEGRYTVMEVVRVIVCVRVCIFYGVRVSRGWRGWLMWG